jgi:hypothetical protein
MYPFFVVYCDQPTFGFCLSPQNRAARAMGANMLMSETEYVGWLHAIRNQKTPHSFPRGLGRVRPAAPPEQPMTVPSLLLLDGAPWPGAELSARHRCWGKDVPVVDLDYLLIDSNDATPLALVDYKHWRAREIDWDRDTSLAAQHAFAGDLPFLVMRYWEKPWRFALDGPPEKRASYPETLATEDQWLMHLRSLRRRGMAA